MDFVTDTHSLVWYLSDDQRLSNKALKSFEGTIKSGLIIVPTVVLAEILFIAKKGRIPLNFSETVSRIESLQNFEVLPLTVEILKLADRIEYSLEMHDKLIVATALSRKAILITKDEQITKSKCVKTVW